LSSKKGGKGRTIERKMERKSCGRLNQGGVGI